MQQLTHRPMVFGSQNHMWQSVSSGHPLTGNNAALAYTINSAAIGTPSNAFFGIIQTRE